MSFTSSDEEDIGSGLDNEWTDKVLRNRLAHECIMKLRSVSNTRFFTTGKIEEIGKKIKEHTPDVVFVNYVKLSNLQKKNLSKEWMIDEQTTVKIMDRFELILQIFANRAKSNIAKYELGLAYLNYAKSVVGKEGGIPVSYLANLRNMSVIGIEEKTAQISGRKSAGKGSMGGEGEKEQNLLLDQVKSLENKLRNLVDKERIKQENRFRDREETRYFRTEPRIALIGYTNVGKSALMNALAGAEHVSSEDRLFETLKTTSKNVEIATNLRAVLVDTIGFISNLPTELINSFGSTLKEAGSADVVLLVEDISHPLVAAHSKVATNLLKKLDLEHLLDSDRLIRVWNKVDCITETRLEELKKEVGAEEQVILTSVTEDVGLEELKAAIEKKINKLFDRKPRKLIHPVEEHEERMAYLKENSNISIANGIKLREEKDGSKFIECWAPLAQTVYERYQDYFDSWNEYFENDKNSETEEVQTEGEDSKFASVSSKPHKKPRKGEEMPEGWLAHPKK